MDRALVGDDVTIRLGNVMRGVGLLRMGDGSGIGSWNWISAHPAFRELSDGAGTLDLGQCARIESRNYIDCSGTVEVGEYGAIGGNRCTVQSHEPDLARMVQTAGRIVVGHHSMVGSNCVMLQGASLPPASILAAHSTMTGKALDVTAPGVYAGTPAVFKRPVEGGWFERTHNPMTRLEVRGHLGPRAASVSPDRDGT
ncbi:acyltransferase [Actinomycetes bacterium M1A6_2h]